MLKEYTVEGMSCGHCKMKVEKAVSALEGVEFVEVVLDDKKIKVSFVGDSRDAAVKDAVDEAGYQFVG